MNRRRIESVSKWLAQNHPGLLAHGVQFNQEKLGLVFVKDASAIFCIFMQFLNMYLVI